MILYTAKQYLLILHYSKLNVFRARKKVREMDHQKDLLDNERNLLLQLNQERWVRQKLHHQNHIHQKKRHKDREHRGQVFVLAK